MGKTYNAILFAPDGDYVTDFYGCDTPEEVEEKLADMGSRWYFYPFHAVVRSDSPAHVKNRRLVSVAQPFEYMRRYAVKTFAAFIKATPEDQLKEILNG